MARLAKNVVMRILSHRCEIRANERPAGTLARLSLRVMPRILISALLLSTAFGHGDIDGLIAAASEEVAMNPGKAEPLIKRGELHSAHEDWIAANADFDRAAALAPDMIAVDFCRGKMLLAAKKPDAAVKAFDRFIAAKGNLPGAFLSRARAKAQLGERAGAVNDFTKAIDMSVRPEPEFYIERAQQQEPEAAIRGLDEGIAKLGPLVTLIIPVIDLEVAEKRYEDALARLERFAATMPRKDIWLARRADIFEKASRTEEAIAAYKSALAAIDGLPQRNQDAKATTDLRAHVEGRLRSLAK